MAVAILFAGIQWLEAAERVPQLYYAFLCRGKCRRHVQSVADRAIDDVNAFVARIVEIDATDADHARSGGGEVALQDRGMIGMRMINHCDYREAAIAYEESVSCALPDIAHARRPHHSRAADSLIRGRCCRVVWCDVMRCDGG
jgi:hypothetical protein